MEWQKYLARLRYYDRMCGNLPTVHQKIAQVQAVVKAYSRHEIPQEVPKLSFSAHYLELHMTKHPELFELVSCLNDLRQVLIENFGIWHVFSRAWLASFKQQLKPGKTLVVMCGNAALAANLSNVIAVDDFDWQAQDNTQPHPWCDVKRADALVAGLLQEIFHEGKLVYKEPTLKETKEFAANNLDGLWDEYKRSLNPQDYPVDLSQKLYDNKMSLINDIRSRIVKRGY